MKFDDFEANAFKFCCEQVSHLPDQNPHILAAVDRIDVLGWWVILDIRPSNGGTLLVPPQLSTGFVVSGYVCYRATFQRMH